MKSDVSVVMFMTIFYLYQRGKCSLLSKKEKRKRYRQKKKIHRHKEKWEAIAFEKLQQRWHERSVNFHKEQIDELKHNEREEERKMKEQMARDNERKEVQLKHMESIHTVEDQYDHYKADTAEKSGDKSLDDTQPLLLDAVLVPIEEHEPSCSLKNPVVVAQCTETIRRARKERDEALHTAQRYRNMAEIARKEKRDLKSKLEGKIETVRNFWRNQIVEGNSRSGRILRESLIRK